MAYTDEYGTEFSEDRRRLIKFNSSWNDFSIPEGTEEIAANAFKGKGSLKRIYLPSSIKKIERGAFDKCKIEEVHFAGDVEQWLQISWESYFDQGYKLFFNETNLVESIIIPESISIIKRLAFYYCSSIHSVIFNKSITTIESDAFNKSGLRGIVSIPKFCESIGNFAFFNCSGITKVKIPESTKRIDYGAFSACYGIKEFAVSPSNECFCTDGVGLYSFIDDAPETASRKLKLIALASANKEKYCINNDAVSIGKDTCCFSSIPKNGLEIHNAISFEKGAIRETKGKIYAPLRLKQVLLEQGLPADNFFPIFVYQDALMCQKHPAIIAENPFRILGVYANASQREIQSNAARIKRFLEIGKQPSFPTDFNNVLPPLERTQGMVDYALSQISQPREKLGYAFLWFSKPQNEQQQNGENLLREGKIIESCEIVTKDCVRFNFAPYLCLSMQGTSSGFNIINWLSVCEHFLLKKRMRKSEQTINQEESWLEEICGKDYSISKEECLIIFFDMLSTFLNPAHLWANSKEHYFSNIVIEHLFDKSIGQNIAHINSQIASLKQIDEKETSTILNAITDLKHNTIDDIDIIDEYLSPSDVRYTSVHDALSDAILQSAIDCYNHADNRSAIARDIYSLMSYANELAKGDLLKNRCKDNLIIIKEAIDDLPPVGLEETDKELYAAVTRARNSADTIEQAKALLKEAEPLLFIIKLESLKQPTLFGSSPDQILAYYTKVSTFIANVCLNKIIADVNSSPTSKCFEAWDVITALNQLPLDFNFIKNRYDENVNILIMKMAPSFYDIRHSKNEISYNLIDLRTEYQVWKDSQKNKNYSQYIKRFPNGKYITEAKELQSEIVRKNAELRKLQEEERAKKRKLQEEERKLWQQKEHEHKFLNWAIRILVMLVAFQIVYLIWGWAGIYISFVLASLIVAIILIIYNLTHDN